MLILVVTFSIDASKKDEALAIMKTAQAGSEAEEGCISYRFYSNPWDESEVHLFERWESAEALAAHGQQAHMTVFREQIAPYLTGETQIKRYTAEEMS